MVAPVVRLEHGAALEARNADVEAQQHHGIELVLVRRQRARLLHGLLVGAQLLHQAGIGLFARHHVAQAHAIGEAVADRGDVARHRDVRTIAEALQTLEALARRW